MSRDTSYTRTTFAFAYEGPGTTVCATVHDRGRDDRAPMAELHKGSRYKAGYRSRTRKRCLSSNNHTEPPKEVLPNNGEQRVRVAVDVVTCRSEGPRREGGWCKELPSSVEQ